MIATINEDGMVITQECTLTKDEAFAVADFIDGNLFDCIRNDTDIDSVQWLRNVLHAYEKMCAASGYVGTTESENSYGHD